MRGTKQVMGEDAAAGDLIRKLVGSGAEIFLYHGIVVMRPENKIPSALRAEAQRLSKEIKTTLTAKFAAERTAPRLVHKWVLRLGDTKPRSNGVLKPAYLACGPHDWCMRMIRQSQELSDPANKYERVRWLILEQDQVGAAVNDHRGVLIASVIALPDGVSLGGPPGSCAEIVSACASCLEPPTTAEKTAEIVKNDE